MQNFPDWVTCAVTATREHLDAGLPVPSTFFLANNDVIVALVKMPGASAEGFVSDTQARAAALRATSCLYVSQRSQGVVLRLFTPDGAYEATLARGSGEPVWQLVCSNQEVSLN